MNKEIIIGKLQSKTEKFGFVIPDEREYWGGDFFVNKDNFNGAKDGDRVEARQLVKTKGKKPEAKILNIIGLNKNSVGFNKKTDANKVLKIIEGIYSGGDGNFGFIDVEGQEKGFFVYGNKKAGAIDGDKVKAQIIMFKDREEAIVLEIIGKEDEIKQGIFIDNEKFGFVLSDDKSGDIFIAGSRKLGAKNGDKVEVKIIKRGAKNPEGVIVKIL